MANIKENKKFHFTYRTTNLINNRYYLGMHSTNRIDDGYLGSGKRLYYELNKYGRNNFKFEILEQFDSREQLVQAEISLITEQDLKNQNCLNLKQGGSGGFYSEEQQRRRATAGGKAFAKRLKEDPEFAQEHKKRSAEKYEKGLRSYILSGVHNHATFKGKTHTAESRKKISENRPRIYGEDNPSYGRIFLNDGKRNTSIKKEDLQMYLNQGWKLGRLKNKS